MKVSYFSDMMWEVLKKYLESKYHSRGLTITVSGHTSVKKETIARLIGRLLEDRKYIEVTIRIENTPRSHEIFAIPPKSIPLSRDN